MRIFFAFLRAAMGGFEKEMSALDIEGLQGKGLGRVGCILWRLRCAF